MPVKSLFSGDVESYLATRPADSLRFMLHIPKTAGSSFRAEIASILTPEYNVHVDGDNRNVSHDQKVIDSLANFKQQCSTSLFRFASGHVTFRQFNQFFGDAENVELWTFLRSPVQRVISEYRYQRTEAHPGHAAFISKYRTIEEYIHDDTEQNKMFHYLKPSDSASVSETIDSVSSKFAFVGLTEMYPLSFRSAMMQLGLEKTPSLVERKTENTSQNQIERSEALQKQILQLNSADAEIYKFFAGVMEMAKGLIWNHAKSQ